MSMASSRLSALMAPAWAMAACHTGGAMARGAGWGGAQGGGGGRGGGPPAPRLCLAPLPDDYRLLGRRLPQQAEEAAAVADSFHVHSDDPGLGGLGPELQVVGRLPGGAVAQADGFVNPHPMDGPRPGEARAVGAALGDEAYGPAISR